MEKKLIKNAEEIYQKAEQKAESYLKILQKQVSEKTFVTTLTTDIQLFKQNHVKQTSALFSKLRVKKYRTLSSSLNYIQWLETTGKLDHYLNRSISYIYMRDLGKVLDCEETEASVQKNIDHLKRYLKTNREEQTAMFSMSKLYRWAQKEHIESTMIWLVNKLKTVSNHIPHGMDEEQAKRKIIKIIAGVMLHVMEGMDEGTPPNERTKKLDIAIRLGYSYGLTYPFIDDLLDAHILSENEETQYINLIKTTLTSGKVPELGEWSGVNVDLIKYLHTELREAFEYIHSHQKHETKDKFFEQSYLFFQSQELDRKKDLENPNYRNEDIFVPIILKSAASRLIIRSLIGAPDDEGFDNRTFYYGIYNQLADDFADIFEDLEKGAVTPYTYYMTYSNKRPDLINPFELYWTVISHLIHNVYHSDRKTCEVILARAINGLKRFKAKNGTHTYNKFMGQLASGIPAFYQVIRKLIKKADDIDFFDKLLRDRMIAELKKEQREQNAFRDLINSVRSEINDILEIENDDHDNLALHRITDAANYSLEGQGKRLRPIMAWIMGVKGYGLDRSAIVPLLRSLEYMHTASLIFDDLPSQDNASLRRGRSTVHRVHNVAVAELTGLFLTQKAVEEQASLKKFDPKTVLQLIQYSAQKTTDLCKGQVMDLDSKGKRLTLEQLRVVSHYKTGVALEASLLMPAILANVNEEEKNQLKKFAYHAGILFQVKDDLLDVEGDPLLLGKTIGKDADNNNSTFVSVLGTDGAKKEMWNHYCLSVEAIEKGPKHTAFLKHLLEYMMHRDD